MDVHRGEREEAGRRRARARGARAQAPGAASGEPGRRWGCPYAGPDEVGDDDAIRVDSVWIRGDFPPRRPGCVSARAGASPLDHGLGEARSADYPGPRGSRRRPQQELGRHSTAQHNQPPTSSARPAAAVLRERPRRGGGGGAARRGDSGGGGGEGAGLRRWLVVDDVRDARRSSRGTRSSTRRWGGARASEEVGGISGPSNDTSLANQRAFEEKTRALGARRGGAARGEGREDRDLEEQVRDLMVFPDAGSKSRRRSEGTEAPSREGPSSASATSTRGPAETPRTRGCRKLAGRRGRETRRDQGMMRFSYHESYLP